MIHHVSVGTDDLARAKAFYDPVLATVGLTLAKESAQGLDYGDEAMVQFSVERPTDKRAASAGNGVHIAFAAYSRVAVDAFYHAALAHGGRGGGAPGLRPDYDANYYGAFAFDPDGNKIEAVSYSAK